MRYIIPPVTTAVNIGISNDTTTAATMYPTWVTTTSGNLPAKISSTKFTFTPSTGVTFSTAFSDSKGDLRAAPQTAVSVAYQLVSSDAGKHISITTGGVTVPATTFNIGDMIMIFNNSVTAQTITTTAVTCYLAGTALVGNRTLAQRGACTLLCVAANTFAISGAGLS